MRGEVSGKQKKQPTAADPADISTWLTSQLPARPRGLPWKRACMSPARTKLSAAGQVITALGPAAKQSPMDAPSLLQALQSPLRPAAAATVGEFCALPRRTPESPPAAVSRPAHRLAPGRDTPGGLYQAQGEPAYCGIPWGSKTKDANVPPACHALALKRPMTVIITLPIYNR
jgi:hypothetical protein